MELFRKRGVKSARATIVQMLNEVSKAQKELILGNIEGLSNYNESEFIRESTALAIKYKTLIEVLIALEEVN